MGNWDNLFMIAAWGVGLLIALLVIGFIFSSLYKRASKEIAFVRTGLGGERVIINGGAIILPVLHGTIDVNMNTMKLEVRRANESALITKDRMRVDVTAEFYVRVQPTKESIANAAQTLGSKTMNPDALKELVEGKFVDALRSVASGMELAGLHENRSSFVQAVQNAVSEDLLKNGLELEAVSLTGLDQTNREHFNPDNVFDAEGLTRMTQEIEQRKKIRNDIEQDTQVAIAQKNLTAQTTKYEIERNQEAARLANEQQIEASRAEQGYEIAAAREQARQRTSSAEIAATQAIELAQQDSKIAVAKKSEETSVADAKANDARAEAVRAEERVNTARATEIAEREKAIQLIDASKQAETESIGIVIAAKAELDAAENRSKAIQTLATGEAEAEKIRATGAEETYRVEAEGKEKLNNAANTLSPEQIAMAVRLKLIEALPEIIAESVKPLQSIDGIKILHVDGMGGFPGAAGGATSVDGGQPNGGGLADSVASAALRYRSQAPLVDALLGELGLNGGSLDGLTRSIAPSKATATSEVATEETAPSSAPPRRAPRAPSRTEQPAG